MDDVNGGHLAASLAMREPIETGKRRWEINHLHAIDVDRRHSQPTVLCTVDIRVEDEDFMTTFSPIRGKGMHGPN